MSNLLWRIDWWLLSLCRHWFQSRLCFLLIRYQWINRVDIFCVFVCMCVAHAHCQRFVFFLCLFTGTKQSWSSIGVYVSRHHRLSLSRLAGQLASTLHVFTSSFVDPVTLSQVASVWSRLVSQLTSTSLHKVRPVLFQFSNDTDQYVNSRCLLERTRKVCECTVKR